MKRNLSLLIAVIFSITLFSCKKERETSFSSTTSIHDELISGSWKVTDFRGPDSTQTDAFAGFVFRFTGDGHTTAANDLLTENGTWSVTGDDSKTKVKLDYTDPDVLNAFVALSGDAWTVTEHSDTKIVMQRIIPDDTETDFLTIEKL